MNELKPLTCPNCGGKINAARMRCEYCGTQFIREEGTAALRIEAVRPGVRTLATNAMIPERYIMDLGDDAIRSIVRDQMSRQLAEALVPMLDLSVGHDFHLNEAIVRGRIRVLEPGYRF